MRGTSVLPLTGLVVALNLGIVARSGAAEPATAAAPSSSSSSDTFGGEIRPLLARYCVDCHGGNKPRAGLNLTSYGDELSILKDRQLSGRLAEHVETGEMP